MQGKLKTHLPNDKSLLTEASLFTGSSHLQYITRIKHGTNRDHHCTCTSHVDDVKTTMYLFIDLFLILQQDI